MGTDAKVRRGILKQNPSYNKPSIVLRNSMKHLGARDTPCLVYLTFLIRNRKLELGVHFDTNAVEYIQGNMYGLPELQKMVARKLKIEVRSRHLPPLLRFTFCKRKASSSSRRNDETKRNKIGNLNLCYKVWRRG